MRRPAMKVHPKRFAQNEELSGIYHAAPNHSTTYTSMCIMGELPFHNTATIQTHMLDSELLGRREYDAYHCHHTAAHRRRRLVRLASELARSQRHQHDKGSSMIAGHFG